MLLQVRRVSTVILCTETHWENMSSGLGLGSKMEYHGELKGRTWSSGHRKCVETTIKRYTRRSNAQWVIEQKDSLI